MDIRSNCDQCRRRMADLKLKAQVYPAQMNKEERYYHGQDQSHKKVNEIEQDWDTTDSISHWLNFVRAITIEPSESDELLYIIVCELYLC